jgi:hypothetical protein
MKKLWLALSDPRLKAALNAVESSGPGLGDLIKEPAGAAGFFRPLRSSLAKASKARPASPASAQALAAAEDFTARLEKLFSDLSLHGTAPDAAALEALLYLQTACAETAGLLSRGGRAGALARVRGLSAGARKTLALAGAAAAASPADFPLNLKFSSIYSGLDAVFDAYERCAEALYRSQS